jgi:hypothetical protein
MIVGAACHRYNSNLRDVDIVHGADSASKKGPPIRPSLNPALSLSFELMSKEPLGSEPLPDAAARGGRRSASPPVASVRLRPIRRSIASRSHLCPVACDPLASLPPCRHRRSRPPFRWQLSPANDRRPRYRLPSQSTRSREAKRMRRVQKIHADRAAERSCSQAGMRAAGGAADHDNNQWCMGEHARNDAGEFLPLRRLHRLVLRGEDGSKPLACMPPRLAIDDRRMIAISFHFVCMLCDCFKSRRSFDRGAGTSLYRRVVLKC